MIIKVALVKQSTSNTGATTATHTPISQLLKQVLHLATHGCDTNTLQRVAAFP